jgi:uncharacterized protein
MKSSAAETFNADAYDPPVRGFLHRPATGSGKGVVLTHGAGGNAQMPLLIALAETFAAVGWAVLRCNLPFRQTRSFGPPRPADAARDREGLKNAVAAMRTIVPGRVVLGGQSYGGRQASMLLADQQLADGLLLLSYPLHPPSRPAQPRTQHLPTIHAPTLFVHGTKDPFGSIEEIESARKLIPARTELVVVESAGHDLGFKGQKHREGLPNLVLARSREFFRA